MFPNGARILSSQRKCQSFQKARVRGRGGITVFGSVVVFRLLIATQEERLTLRRGPFLEGMGDSGKALAHHFAFSRQSSPLHVSSRHANRHELRVRAYASPTTAARKDRRSQTVEQVETSPMGIWLSGLPP